MQNRFFTVCHSVCIFGCHQYTNFIVITAIFRSFEFLEFSHFSVNWNFFRLIFPHFTTFSHGRHYNQMLEPFVAMMGSENWSNQKNILFD